ncbi:hypothetical protein [Deinococcus alpinitundrae]|uniref:hypothetical protein n=1 Tax=Deinococcus alpinitundrae TaxID=468913 RepID=UPI00137A3748|nr:hypothetical protein [Deinococcus alpinitundrae]
MTKKLTLHALLPHGARLTLSVLSTTAYLGVAVTELRLDSVYRTRLALLLSAGALYGVYRAATSMILLSLR